MAGFFGNRNDEHESTNLKTDLLRLFINTYVSNTNKEFDDLKKSDASRLSNSKFFALLFKAFCNWRTNTKPAIKAIKTIAALLNAPLNIVKLVTEILPETIASAAYFAAEHLRFKYHNPLAYLPLYLVFALSRVAYLYGRSITSPITSVRAAWNTGFNMGMATGFKAPAYFYALVFSLISVSATAATYVLLAPLAIKIAMASAPAAAKAIAPAFKAVGQALLAAAKVPVVGYIFKFATLGANSVAVGIGYIAAWSFVTVGNLASKVAEKVVKKMVNYFHVSAPLERENDAQPRDQVENAIPRAEAVSKPGFMSSCANQLSSLFSGNKKQKDPTLLSDTELQDIASTRNRVPYSINCSSSSSSTVISPSRAAGTTFHRPRNFEGIQSLTQQFANRKK